MKTLKKFTYVVTIWCSMPILFVIVLLSESLIALVDKLDDLAISFEMWSEK